MGENSYIAGHAYVTGELSAGADCTVNPYATVRGRIVLGNGVRIGAHSSLLGFNHGFSPARPRPNCPVPSTPSGCVPCRIPPPDWSPSTPPTEVLEHRPPRHPTVGPTTAPPGITCCRWAAPWICSARASPHSRLLRPVRRAGSVRRADGGHRDGPRPGSALVRPRARERLRCARRGSLVVARGATERPPCRRSPRLGGGAADTGPGPPAGRCRLRPGRRGERRSRSRTRSAGARDVARHHLAVGRRSGSGGPAGLPSPWRPPPGAGPFDGVEPPLSRSERGA